MDPRFKIALLYTPPECYLKARSVIEFGAGEPSQLFERLTIEWIKNGLLDSLSYKKRQVANRRQQIVREILYGYDFVSQSSAFHIWLPLNAPNIDRIVTGIKNDEVDILGSRDCQVSNVPGPGGLRIAFGNVRSDEELIRGLKILVKHITYSQ
ncbi:hypothetical protein [Dyadobacter sp. CY261]|uniref:hypothetical protein n=1 Tax=Dyadobacter sp. CY261 TaxID=2907203 RepID=UPI001F2099A2|nr:hypothetical protein [Dyadobacter sp. CY261]